MALILALALRGAGMAHLCGAFGTFLVAFLVALISDLTVIPARHLSCDAWIRYILPCMVLLAHLGAGAAAHPAGLDQEPLSAQR